MRDIAEYLEIKTHNLRDEIEWIKTGRGADPQAALEHLRHLRSELSACGGLLRHLEIPSSQTAQRSVADYRDCLQRLQEALPILQSDLLMQRSRLQPQREHVDAATQWLHCNQTTLE